jgi:hypothetical protein
VRPAEPLTRYDAALAWLARPGRCLAVISQSRLTSSSGLLVRSAVPGAVHSAIAAALPTLGESFAALETHGPTLGPNPRLVSPHWQLDPVRHAAKPVSVFHVAADLEFWDKRGLEPIPDFHGPADGERRLQGRSPSAMASSPCSPPAPSIRFRPSSRVRPVRGPAGLAHGQRSPFRRIGHPMVPTVSVGRNSRR